MRNDPHRDLSDSFDIDTFQEDNLCDTYAEMREAQELDDWDESEPELDDDEEWDPSEEELDADL
jgi:hypothetical protein